MGEKTYILSKAQALDDMGMGELAGTLWREAGRREEEIAPLLEAIGREREAAAHRISAASCCEKAGDFARAANLYRAALAGPLLEHTRQRGTVRPLPGASHSSPVVPCRFPVVSPSPLPPARRRLGWLHNKDICMRTLPRAIMKAADALHFAFVVAQFIARSVFVVAQFIAYHLKLRMGIHSGPVSRVTDINGNENITGSGMNTARRVTDCGDAGHILLSKRSADDINEFENWAEYLTDLGECEVKYGERVHLYNLCMVGVGNPEVPQKMRDAKMQGYKDTEAQGYKDAEAQERTAASLHPGIPAPLHPSQQVALLYKRSAQPDEQVLHLLETQLTAQGYRVFVDRHMHIGVEWATEIERQVRSSYAVIPLISEASIHSEMLEYEVETAHKAAQAQNGVPRILPVRINFAAPIPGWSPLAAILNPLQYSLYQSEADSERLVSEIVNALRNPPKPKTERGKLEAVGGALPLDSEFYIARSTDDDFKTAIARRDSIVLVKGARQMGKTSLLARGLQQARESGAKVVLTDFQTLNTTHLQSPETLFLTLAEAIADQLDLDVMPEDVWNERRGANTNLERYLRREVLESMTEPLVWGMDEVDRLFSCDFGSEVFGLFRSWHNKRALDPTGPWSRLTLAIVYSTEPHLFITDVNQSPFNVGTRLTLEDFTLEQVAELNRRYGAPLRDADELQRFYNLLGGHPYLTQRALSEMVSHDITFAALEAQADRDEGIFGDHLRRILVLLTQDPELTEIVRGILRSPGVMSGDSAQDAKPRCQLCRKYLERHLL